jgi:SAM-dependent methyltransferase
MTDQDDQAALRAAGAAIFAQAEVAASYYARQPYAPAAYETLLAQVPGRARALDLGCGPGPVARVLAERFGEVVALDPSAPMIAEGQAADAGAHPNIRWLCARAEDFGDNGNFDVVTAGSSIHWVDPAAVFPKLARLTGLIAMLANDPLFPRPPPPCGIEAWLDFLTRWNERVGRATPARWRDSAPALEPGRRMSPGSTSPAARGLPSSSLKASPTSSAAAMRG